MKTKLFLLAIGVALLTVGASAKIKAGSSLTGNSLTEFGKYTISVSETPMVVNNETVKTFNLMYENTTNPVQIGQVKTEKCTTYIVRSDEFEIQYTCNNGVFGVKKLEAQYQQLPKEEMDAKLDRVNYFAQRVICQNKKSEDELLGLIACYFPKLIKEDYQANF
ncbi:MAG: hypothetical protein AB7S72_10025 [Draconibacterium sp.]